MASLSNDTLLRILRNSLPGCHVTDSNGSPKPATVITPDENSFRIYLWTATPDNSRAGRPQGEHKLQIILPGTPRGSTQRFDLSGPETPALLGYSPLFGVFVLWEISGHDGASYSKNVQVTETLLAAASESGWAIAEPRQLAHMPEVRCAVHPSHLLDMLRAHREADARHLRGAERQTFLESSAPDLASNQRTLDPNDLPQVTRQRQLVYQQTLSRDSGFSKRILPLFRYSCAVCGTQMHVVEAAHIMPVHDPRSTDFPDNGIALCRNHHRLFDTRILKIDGSGYISADDEIIQVIRSSGRDAGMDTLLLQYANQYLAVFPQHDDQASQASWEANLNNFFTL